MDVCKATLGHRLLFGYYSSLFRAALEAQKEKPRSKDQRLNESIPRQNKTAPVFVPLNSFPASVPQGPISSQSTERARKKDYECTVEIRSQRQGLL